MDPKLRAIVVGTGGRGTMWLVPALAARDDVELVALADVCMPRAEFAARGLEPAPAVYTTVAQALAGVECDAVFVTTTDAGHAEAVLPALAAGKVVFCEKPLDATLEGCRAIIEADEQKGGRTFVGLNLRYAPTYVTAKRLLDEGVVGNILTVQMDEFYDGGRTYFRRWNRLRSHGGGLWITKACHDFDLMAWLVGASPVSVAAFSDRTHYVPKAGAGTQCRACPLVATCPDRAPETPAEYVTVWEQHGGPPHDLCLYNSDSDTFDHGIATVRFDNATLGAYTCNVVAGFSDRRLRVSGTKGTLEGSLVTSELTLRRRDPAATETVPVGDTSGGHGGADGNVLENFLAFARGEAEPKCRPREASLAVRMGLAARLSCDEGRVVSFSEFAL